MRKRENGPPREADSDAADTGGRWAALGYRDFRLYWIGQGVSSAGTQMQSAAVAWQVYLLTNSAVALGLLGLVRVVPIITLSLFGGVVADALDRRRLLMLTQTIMMLLSGALALTTLTGRISVWGIYALTAMSAAATSFDSPARQAMVPSLLPRQHLTSALGLQSTIFQVATVLGPALGGIVIATLGVVAVYLVDVVSYLAVLIAIFTISPPAIIGPISRVSFASAIEGLRFMRQTPILMSTSLLDFIATFFGSATALLPIFARHVLAVGSQGYGILYASPAVGAIVAGTVMSVIGGRLRRQGAIILIAVAAYGLFTVGFGLSRIFLVSILCLVGTGVADTVSMVLRQTVRQLSTPDELRGRMSSVSMMFFMGGPQLGEIEAGLLARSFGAPFSVISGGIAAVLATVLIAQRARGLREYDLWKGGQVPASASRRSPP